MEYLVPKPAGKAFLTRGLQKRAHSHAAELVESRNEFLSTVCHELRTPLAVIRGYTSLLLDHDDRLQDGERRDYVESIDRAACRMVELADHILDMARVDSGLLQLEQTPIAASEVAREAVAEARVRAPGHTIRFEQKNGLRPVRIDARRIRQVLDNILDNAIKYSQEGTEIVVSLTPQEKELLISVADQGIGIAAGELDRVFERLYRVQCHSTPHNRGVGLGLAICRGLVEAHGGRIWMESEEGKGSTVRFTLPF